MRRWSWKSRAAAPPPTATPGGVPGLVRGLVMPGRRCAVLCGVKEGEGPSVVVEQWKKTCLERPKSWSTGRNRPMKRVFSSSEASRARARA